MYKFAHLGLDQTVREITMCCCCWFKCVWRSHFLGTSLGSDVSKSVQQWNPWKVNDANVLPAPVHTPVPVLLDYKDFDFVNISSLVSSSGSADAGSSVEEKKLVGVISRFHRVRLSVQREDFLCVRECLAEEGVKLFVRNTPYKLLIEGFSLFSLSLSSQIVNLKPVL